MPFYVSQILNSLSFIALIIGLIRYRQMLHTYRPFFYFILAGIVNDLVSNMMINLYRTNTVNSNIYVLIEFLLICWLFRNWANNKRLIDVLAVCGILIWTADDLVFHRITQFNAWFRIWYSFCVTALSVTELNKILFTRNKNIWKNAAFIICLAFILFYSYRAAFEIFFYPDMHTDKEFRKNLLFILIFINALTNLIFAYAMLCIPKKQRFIITY